MWLIFPTVQPCTTHISAELTLMAFLQWTYCKRTRRHLVLGSNTQQHSLQTAKGRPCCPRAQGSPKGSEAAGVLRSRAAQRAPESGRMQQWGRRRWCSSGSNNSSWLTCQDSGMVAPANVSCRLRNGSCPRGSQQSSCYIASAAPL